MRCMSFDILFEPCRYDGTTARRRNAFTNEIDEIACNQPLSAQEVAAVASVLDRVGAKAPDEHGCRVVRLADGTIAEIDANDCARGCVLSTRGGVTLALSQLLFDLAAAGNWVMMPLGGDGVVIAPSAECVKNAPSFYGRIVVARSAREVAAALKGGFDDYKHHRASVV
jgi:hypothetical protein